MSDNQKTRSFATPGPASVTVEIGAGSLTVLASETDHTDISVTGRNADLVTIEEVSGAILVKTPKAIGFLRDTSVGIRVDLPTGSSLRARAGSADILIEGALADLDTRTGSGDVVVQQLTGAGHLIAGSGTITVRDARDLSVKCGSGDAVLDRLDGTITVTTGSGDVRAGTITGDAGIKTGSGDALVTRIHGSVQFASGSGDLRIEEYVAGSVRASSASGDVVLGIPAGTPVWTEITSVSGRVQSTIERVGAPEEGQDHVAVRVRTVSGDVSLRPA